LENPEQSDLERAGPPEPPAAEPAPPVAAPAPRRKFPTLNLVLFLLTGVATVSVGADMAVGASWTPPPDDVWGLIRAGLPFSLSLLVILVSHEMGHFVAARHHRVDASWPYFIPFPWGVGTLGAVIRMRGRIPTRNALVDIGASGPLAGAVVAIPVLLYGLHLSRIDAIPVEPNLLFGNLSIFHLAKSWWVGVSPYAFGSSMEPQPLLYVLLKRVVFAVHGNQDVFVHPIAFAGVIGLFVTALNLMPVGQLDGGHVAYAVFGDRARKVGQAFAVLMIGMAIFSSATWLLWVLLVGKFVGFRHPPVEREEPLSTGRRIVVVATAILFLLTLTPVAADML
jgi:membrane-associated protease RseP (regulator of RpoE activity)